MAQKRKKSVESLTKLKNQIKKAKRVGLDTNCFLYVLSEHPAFFQPAKTVFATLEKNKIPLITSIVTLIELLYFARKKGGEKVLIDYQDVLVNFPNLRLVPTDIEIAKKAVQLRVSYSLTTPDAIQLATAIISDCQIFISNDDFFLRCQKEIPILLLKDFS